MVTGQGFPDECRIGNLTGLVPDRPGYCGYAMPNNMPNNSVFAGHIQARPLVETPPAPESPPGVATTTVFKPGEQGYKAFRIPGMLAFKEVLMVFAEGRKYGCGDFAGQHDIVFKRSTDRGATWSNFSVLMDPAKMFGDSVCPVANRITGTGSCEFWDPTPFADAVTGRVFMMTTRSWPHTVHGSAVDNEAARMHGLMDCWLISSDDLGLTWSEPLNITQQVWSDQWHMMTPANGHAIQSYGNRLLMPGYVRPGGTDGSSMSAVFYSDDHGVTWSFAPNSTIGPGTSESEIVRLQHTPNRLMFNHRGPGHKRWQSFSDDNGLTWHDFQPAPLLPDPGCKGGIAAWPSKKSLLFVNAATTHARVNITLRVSPDDGRSWPVQRLISGPGGYSDVQLATLKGKESVCVVFEYDSCTIKVGCIDGEDLLPGQ